MTRDSFRAAAALAGARLRGDAEGERVLIGDCGCECRSLIEGLVKVAETAITAMAEHDNVTPADAAESLAQWLRDMPGGSAGG